VSTEAAPTWEQIVEWVTCSSNHLAVRFAASQWEEALRQSTETVQWVQELSRRNAQSWKGPGAEAFRAHLKDLIAAIDADADQQRKTITGLKRCAEALATAVRSIPVPSWQYDEVRQRQLDFVVNGVPANIQPHVFWQTLIGPNPQGWTAPALQMAEEFVRGAEAQAQQAYLRLCREYREAAQHMPDGTRVPVPGVTKKAGGGGAGTGNAGKPATAPTTPTPTLPTTQTPTPSLATPPTTELPPIDPPSITTPDLPGLEPPKPGKFDPIGGLDKDFGTGLAGAGGGGLGGGGIGTGGLGAGLGNVAALGSPGMGPAATPPAGVLAARATAATGGTGGFGVPYAPAAGGAGGMGDGKGQGATRNVDIHEDEAIFHPRQASSGVIDI